MNEKLNNTKLLARLRPIHVVVLVLLAVLVGGIITILLINQSNAYSEMIKPVVALCEDLPGSPTSYRKPLGKVWVHGEFGPGALNVEGAASVEEADTIICLEPYETSVDCGWYQSGGRRERYTLITLGMGVRVIDWKTKEFLNSTAKKGESPDECPEVISEGGEKRGSPVDAQSIADWLQIINKGDNATSTVLAREFHTQVFNNLPDTFTLNAVDWHISSEYPKFSSSSRQSQFLYHTATGEELKVTFEFHTSNTVAIRGLDDRYGDIDTFMSSEDAMWIWKLHPYPEHWGKGVWIRDNIVVRIYLKSAEDEDMLIAVGQQFTPIAEEVLLSGE
jgi:hypothetical protein